MAFTLLNQARCRLLSTCVRHVHFQFLENLQMARAFLHHGTRTSIPKTAYTLEHPNRSARIDVCMHRLATVAERC